MPVWRELNLAQRAYVPLQWAETFEHMLMLTQDRVAECEQKVHLVGFSLGGFVASQYACQHPQRVASLTLIGASAKGLTTEEEQQRLQIVKAIDAGKYKGMGKYRLKQMMHADNLDNQVLVDSILQMNDDLGPGVLKAQIQATTPRPDCYKALKQLDIPIHIIGAKADQIAPLEDLQAMAKGFKQATLHTIEQAGHMLPMEQPQKLAKVLYQLFH